MHRTFDGSHGGYYRKMFIEFLANLFFQVVLLQAVINAELLPETKQVVSRNNTNFHYDNTRNENIHTQNKESNYLRTNSTLPFNRNSRQVPNLFQNKQPGFSSSFLNRLNTHGLAITGNIGIGVRYASGNSYNGDGVLAHQNHRENTNNVYDRYLGTTFNIGTNLHLLNKADDHSSYNTGLGNRKEDDTGKILASDNSTNRHTLWKRLNQYFTKSKSPDVLNGTIIDCNEMVDFENCTQVATSNSNVLSRFINKYFSKTEPRKVAENETISEIHSHALQKALGDIEADHNNTHLFDKVTKYFNRNKFSSIIEQIWNDRINIYPKNKEFLAVNSDYNTFRNTVRDFLVERISTYVSQNSTNENFVLKFVKKTLSQMMSDFQTQETKEQSLNERNTLMKYLTEYFNNERIKKFFPDIETIRNSFIPSQWFEYEGSYASGWLKNNFSHLLDKHSRGNLSQF